MAEERDDPEHVGRVPHSLEYEHEQKHHIKNRENERQRERLDQERLGVVLWLKILGMKVNSSHNEGILGRRERVVTVNR